MQTGKLVEISANLMKILSKADIRMEDYRFVDLWKECEEGVGRGMKVSYLVCVLAEKYGISEASVYRILRRFKRVLS